MKMEIKYLGSNGVGLIAKNWGHDAAEKIYDVFQISPLITIGFPRDLEYDCAMVRKRIKEEIKHAAWHKNTFGD
jgi:hypothetical protein